MSEKFISAGVTILIAIVGVAYIAVLVSRQAQTPQVISAASQGFAQDLLCALSPVTGGGGGGILGSGGACGTSVTSGITFPGL
jgi:hypothetical protein